MPADFEARVPDPEGRALLLDVNGFVAETGTTNFLFIKQGELHTPTTRNVLEGPTRETIFELAEKLSIPAHEGNYTVDDVLRGEEAFLPGTSPNILPVRSINGVAFSSDIRGSRNRPGSEHVVGACRHRHRGAGPKPPSYVDEWGWGRGSMAAPRGDRPIPSIPNPRANLQSDLPYGQRLHATAFRLGKSFGRNAFVKISDTCGTRGTLKTPRATSRVILIFLAEIFPRPCFFP